MTAMNRVDASRATTHFLLLVPFLVPDVSVRFAKLKRLVAHAGARTRAWGEGLKGELGSARPGGTHAEKCGVGDSLQRQEAE